MLVNGKSDVVDVDELDNLSSQAHLWISVVRRCKVKIPYSMLTFVDLLCLCAYS
jgi:hypothetical protein